MIEFLELIFALIFGLAIPFGIIALLIFGIAKLIKWA